VGSEPSYNGGRVLEERAQREARHSRVLTDALANCTASSISAASRSGKSRGISSVVIPSRSMATTVSTGMRSPRMHGTPPICPERMVMRGKPWAMKHGECSVSPQLCGIGFAASDPSGGLRWGVSDTSR
jgi:hypothetical protein